MKKIIRIALIIIISLLLSIVLPITIWFVQYDLLQFLKTINPHILILDDINFLQMPNFFNMVASSFVFTITSLLSFLMYNISNQLKKLEFQREELLYTNASNNVYTNIQLNLYRIFMYINKINSIDKLDLDIQILSDINLLSKMLKSETNKFLKEYYYKIYELNYHILHNNDNLKNICIRNFGTYFNDNSLPNINGLDEYINNVYLDMINDIKNLITIEQISQDNHRQKTNQKCQKKKRGKSIKNNVT